MFSSPRTIAILQLFMAAVCWSLGGLLIKLADWNALAIAGGRSAVAAIVLGLFFYRRRSLPLHRYGLLGAVAYCLTLASFVAATRLTTAANAIVLQYTAPVYVLVFGWWFLGERARWFDWAGVGGALLGMGLFFFDRLSTEGMAGNALAVFSGLAFAALVMLLRHQKDGEPLDSVFVGNILTVLIGLPGMLASRPDLRTLGILVVLGTVQIALPYVLYTQAIKRVSALEGLLIPVIEPILNPFWVMLVIGEVPGRWALLGAVVVVSAITARGVAAQRATPDPDLPAGALKN